MADDMSIHLNHKMIDGKLDKIQEENINKTVVREIAVPKLLKLKSRPIQREHILQDEEESSVEQVEPLNLRYVHFLLYCSQNFL